MEITGKIIVALEPRSGVSNNTGNPWKMQAFVLETTTEQYLMSLAKIVSTNSIYK